MSDKRGEMTPQELDELASAYLDGEATEEEATLVESDPRLQALVEELRAVRDLVAAPVDLPSDEVRDQMIAQALDHRAPVISLKKTRRMRAVPPQARVILAAAAVIAAIAVVGVTILERQSDEFADDDMASASQMADAPADAEPEAPAPVPAAEPERAETAEEPLPSPDSGDSAEVFMAEAPAEEMMDEEMAIDHAEAPMDEEFASDEPAEDQGEPEPVVADAAEAAPAPGEAPLPLVFETAADLATYAMQLAEEQRDPQELERLEDASGIDLMGCPLFPDEGLKLLARFDAVVDDAEVQVSVYLSGSDLQLTETTPPPECGLLNSHTFLDWSK